MTQKPPIEQFREILLQKDRQNQERANENISELERQLKNLKEEHSRLEQDIQNIENRLKNPAKQQDIVNPLLDERISDLKRNFYQYFGLEVTETVKKEIRSNNDEVIDAFYPILGKMVRRYIRAELNSMSEKVNQFILQTTEPSFWFARLKSALGFKQQENKDNALINQAKIRELFFIQHHTGLIVGSYSSSFRSDVDLIGSLLTAIITFANDAFTQNNNYEPVLASLDYSVFKIILTPSRTHYFATVVEGDYLSEAEIQKIHDLAEQFGDLYLPPTLPDLDSNFSAKISLRLKNFYKTNAENLLNSDIIEHNSETVE